MIEALKGKIAILQQKNQKANEEMKAKYGVFKFRQNYNRDVTTFKLATKK